MRKKLAMIWTGGCVPSHSRNGVNRLPVPLGGAQMPCATDHWRGVALGSRPEPRLALEAWSA